MCLVMNATEKAWIFRGEGQAAIPCKGKTTEAFQEILQSFSNCSLFQHHYATSVCFPASLPLFILPILPAPTSSKCCEAAPLREPEIQCRFFSPPPPLSLNCPNLSGEEHCPKSARYSSSPGNDKQHFMNHLLYIALSTRSTAGESKPGPLWACA